MGSSFVRQIAGGRGNACIAFSHRLVAILPTSQAMIVEIVMTVTPAEHLPGERLHGFRTEVVQRRARAPGSSADAFAFRSGARDLCRVRRPAAGFRRREGYARNQ